MRFYLTNFPHPHCLVTGGTSYPVLASTCPAASCICIIAAPNLNSVVLKLPEFLHGTDPGMPLLPASDYPPTCFPVAAFCTVSPAILCLGDKPTPYSEFSSSSRISHELPASSESFHRGGGPPSVASGGLLYRPLWASMSTKTTSVWTVWAAKREGAERLLTQKQRHSGAAFRDMPQQSQYEPGKTLTPQKPLGPTEEPEPGMRWVLCDCLDGVKGHEDGDHLTPRKLPTPRLD